MKTSEMQVHEIDPRRVKVFVHRERNAEEHARAIEDTRRRGQIEPGEVRRIKGDPQYDFALVVGEGRLLRAKALKKPFRAFIVEKSEVETVGRFLSENMNRVALPWAQKARLVQPLLASGVPAEEIAKRHSLTVGHVLKFRRIIDKTSAGLEDEVAAMPMNDAEEFTALPAGHQGIVMQVFKATRELSIRDLVKKAKEVAAEDDGELSAAALRKSLDRTEEDLRRQRDRLKLLRLHWSLSVPNLKTLFADKRFRKAAVAEGINVAKFEKLTSDT